jgi:microcystin degradation protein MlrC
LADFWDAGLSVVTVSDGDREAAERSCEGLLDAAWRERHEFVFESESLAETIERAKGLEGGPIILLDHADNAASGGTQDTVRVLEEVIEQGLEEVAMFAICDPQAVEEMADSGVGSTLTLKLGGKFDMPAIGRRGEPIELRGAVRAITDGNFVVTAEMGRGTTESLGRTAVLDPETHSHPDYRNSPPASK